jgi:DNA-binding NtrC family response regulator
MRYNILAVDDEPHMLVLLDRIVREKTPYTILTTNNSLEVSRLLEQNTFDLIIADLKMPGMDGIDILRMVKEQKREEEVIIITAFGSLETAVEALSFGVLDYITKPFKKEQIIFTVDRAVKWQQMKRTVKDLSTMFELEPYERALDAFEKAYILKLSERYKGDSKVMSEKAGISQDRIRQAMDLKKT